VVGTAILLDGITLIRVYLEYSHILSYKHHILVIKDYSIMATKRPIQHTEDNRRRIRRFYQAIGPNGKPPTQSDCVLFARNELGIEINQSMVSKWTSDKFTYLDGPSTLSSKTKALPDRVRHRNRPYDRLEIALYEWIKRLEVIVPLKGDTLRTKASQIFNRMPNYTGQPEPKWSNGWLQNFQRKYDIHSSRRYGEAGSANAINCDEDIEAIQVKIAPYPLEDIYNCDETGLFYKAVPDLSLTTKQLPGHKIKKERLTAMHTCNAAGHRMRIWFIGKAANPRCFKRVKIEAMNLFWRNNKKAWMNTEIMMEFLRWFDKQMAGR